MKVSDLSVLYIKDGDDKYEEQIFKVLKENVNKTSCAFCIEDAISLYKKNSPCLIIINSHFKNERYINFLKSLRAVDLKTAFIVVSSSKNNHYMKDLMELYITKYIDTSFKDELLIEALNKCMEIISKRLYSNVNVGKDMFFNFHTQSIIKNNHSYILNKKQALLIDLFIQNPNRIVSYEEIKFHVWDEEVTDAAFKSLFRDLRKCTYKTIVQNYSGLGYKLNT